MNVSSAAAVAFALAAARISAVDFGAEVAAGAGVSADFASGTAAAAGAAVTGVDSAAAALFAARILERMSLVEGVGSVIQPRHDVKEREIGTLKRVPKYCTHSRFGAKRFANGPATD